MRRYVGQISTHAPLAGRDGFVRQIGRRVLVFQPTRPLRGATSPVIVKASDEIDISTHAPLAGRDCSRAVRIGGEAYFNPRAPCGARRQILPLPICRITHFNPRAPCGARPCRAVSSTSSSYFNPRAPCGARPISAPLERTDFVFQPTRPLRGATAKVYKSLCTFLR